MGSGLQTGNVSAALTCVAGAHLAVCRRDAVAAALWWGGAVDLRSTSSRCFLVEQAQADTSAAQKTTPGTQHCSIACNKRFSFGSLYGLLLYSPILGCRPR